MELTTILFYVFALILVIASFKVVSSSNPVQSALFLVLAFFNAAAIWMLLQAEFLAIMLVLVYVGAVMVLFLFVVMMIDTKLNELRSGFRRFLPLGSLLGVIMIVEAGFVLMQGYGRTRKSIEVVSSTEISNAKVLGIALYSEYIYAFEVAGLLLLLAIVAAIALTIRTRKDHKKTEPSNQVRVKATERVHLVSMSAKAWQTSGSDVKVVE
ncbi:NADH-quinone oxidoreductase subunit J [Candidatus Pandoraea novymonadis]|uniref:NADH-quinone oxidoreductase subunit J n=1 Tax=Candidatus Pandoraea novymonadis TaxID=1808959 RepID=A0ABX5FDT0_9BURK|nr:NADH-quinone oxidoreductase subunit J [Candidatus Pandoraea novymonadis]PSB91855.1 NADH-quinone oxidoreductase subunit J [Candidatus Pandoraea novymonadis]